MSTSVQNQQFMVPDTTTCISFIKKAFLMLLDGPIMEAIIVNTPIFNKSKTTSTHRQYPDKPINKPIGAKPYEAFADLGILDTQSKEPPPKCLPKNPNLTNRLNKTQLCSKLINRHYITSTILSKPLHNHLEPRCDQYTTDWYIGKPNHNTPTKAPRKCSTRARHVYLWAKTQASQS